MGEASALSGVQLKLRPGARIEQEFYRAIKRLPAVRGVAPIRAAKANMVEILEGSQSVMTVIMLGFAAALFFGAILNASLISMSERLREIATFRVLGYDSLEVGGIFLRETVVVNGVGTLLGLPMGWWLCEALVKANETELFRIPMVIRPLSWVWTVALAIAFTLLAHALVLRQIRKLDWLSALNVRE